MSMRNGYLTDRGSIDRPALGHLTYAYHVKIMVFGLEVKDHADISCLKQLVELVTPSVNPNFPGELSCKLESLSPALIMRSIFTATHCQVNLPTHAHINFSERLASFAPVLGRLCMLEVPSLIVLQGSIATIHRTRAVTFCALSMSSDAPWQEPPPYSIRTRKMTQDLSPAWATLGAGVMRSGNLEGEQMSE